MNLSAIRLKAVVLGLLTDFVVSIGSGFMIGLSAGMAGAQSANLSSEQVQALTEGTGFRIIALLAAIAAPGLGGYVAARIGYPDWLENALVIGVLDILLSLTMGSAGTGTPQGLLVLGVVLAIPAALLGGKFASD